MSQKIRIGIGMVLPIGFGNIRPNVEVELEMMDGEDFDTAYARIRKLVKDKFVKECYAQLMDYDKLTKDLAGTIGELIARQEAAKRNT